MLEKGILEIGSGLTEDQLEELELNAIAGKVIQDIDDNKKLDVDFVRLLAETVINETAKNLSKI
jgi:hypothetical protein